MKYICNDCAKEKMCKWPVNHVGHFFTGICGFCGKDKEICYTTDWIWDTAEDKYWKLKYEEIFGSET